MGRPRGGLATAKPVKRGGASDRPLPVFLKVTQHISSPPIFYNALTSLHTVDCFRMSHTYGYCTYLHDNYRASLRRPVPFRASSPCRLMSCSQTWAEALKFRLLPSPTPGGTLSGAGGHGRHSTRRQRRQQRLLQQWRCPPPHAASLAHPLAPAQRRRRASLHGHVVAALPAGDAAVMRRPRGGGSGGGGRF